jgi:TfoX/Sxy family transcriptional regulator of competence genes
MAYNILLSQRIDQLIKNKKGFTRKEMFGGIGYMFNGNMCVGVHKDDLIVRFDPEISDSLMSKKNVMPFAITGRPMKGWLLVNDEGVKGNELEKWFELAFAYIKKLPPKK